MTESEYERIVDRRVQQRLASDAQYRNAANAEQQSRREHEISVQECARLDAEQYANPSSLCQWFAGCANAATTSHPHPVLGSVRCCERCKRFASS